jgi:hypothetical protein
MWWILTVGRAKMCDTAHLIGRIALHSFHSTSLHSFPFCVFSSTNAAVCVSRRMAQPMQTYLHIPTVPLHHQSIDVIFHDFPHPLLHTAVCEGAAKQGYRGNVRLWGIHQSHIIRYTTHVVVGAARGNIVQSATKVQQCKYVPRELGCVACCMVMSLPEYSVRSWSDEYWGKTATLVPHWVWLSR